MDRQKCRNSEASSKVFAEDRTFGRANRNAAHSGPQYLSDSTDEYVAILSSAVSALCRSGVTCKMIVYKVGYELHHSN
jgi:hypothetical protein